MKGDRVEVVIDAGGDTKTYEVTATRAGRRVDIRTGRGLVEVTEVTRGGTAVRTARFMASRVLALVEHPAPRRGYVWVNGHHGYRHHRYYWVRGHYVRERRGWDYAPGRWDRHDDHYDYYGGEWHPHR